MPKAKRSALDLTSMKVESWPIERVKPYPGNARKNESTVEKVRLSIEQFGFNQPIVVDPKGIVVVGHTRLEAAKRLKLKAVPVTVMRDRTEPEIAAYRLMDNRSHEESLWDEELLAEEIGKLTAAGVDVRLTGFDDSELQRLLGEIEAPAIAEPPASVKSNVERLERVKTMRAKGNAGVIEKSDTEHYLVVVYPDRASRENAVKRLGLPADERYVAAEAVELRQRVGGQREIRVKAERSTAAAQPKKSGATG